MGLSFAEHTDVLGVADVGVAVIREAGTEVWAGPGFVALAGRLDRLGDRSALLDGLPSAEQDGLLRGLDELRRAGVLVDASPPPRDAPAGRVVVRPLPGIDAAATVDALVRAGVEVVDEHASAELTLVLVADYLQEELEAVNRRALEASQPWMLAQPASARVLVGPVLSPDRGPCWACLAQRIFHQRRVEFELRNLATRPRVEPPSSSSLGEPTNGRQGAMSSAGARFTPGSGWSRSVPAPESAAGVGPALVATHLARVLAGESADATSTLVSFDVRSWETARHHVQWRPQCPACGEGEPPTDVSATPIRLRRPRSGSGSRGSLRARTANEMLRRLEPHVSPLTGAVHALRKQAGPDHMHVYVSGGPTPLVHGRTSGLQRITGSQAGGKGTSDAAARASALAEALERYSGDFSGIEPRRAGRYVDLRDDAIHPYDYMRFSPRQYAEREDWNARSATFRTHVPEPFDEEESIDWTPVWSLTHERERLFPTALAFYNADVAGARSCVAESNGNAAGGSLEEAILHGLLELIERDHVALWWYNRLALPSVDLDSIRDPWLAQLRRQIAAEGRRFWVFDLTADLGVPVAAALVASADGSGVGMGLGAHLELEGAVVRAATELAQLGLGAPSGGLGDGVEHDLHLDRQTFLVPDPGRPSSVAGEDSFDGDVVDALERCRSAIEAQDVEVLVLDQTRPDIRLPVVKVIAPGLRHFWPRFGPGRLFEVPVRLGRLERPLAEDELNPIPPTP